MRAFVLVAMGLALAASTGCATIFSGSSQHVAITSDAPDTTCITLGGTIGTWVAGASLASDTAQKIFDALDPVIGPDARAALRTADLNELVTLCALTVADTELPEALVKGRDYFRRLPDSVKEKFLEWFAVLDVGTAPRRPRLRRGRFYTIIGWAPGHKAKIEVISPRFNWVTLWNILNFGIGLAVDIPTGAWLKLKAPIAFELPKIE